MAFSRTFMCIGSVKILRHPRQSEFCQFANDRERDGPRRERENENENEAEKTEG